MQAIIYWIIWIVIFAIAAWALLWVCDHFQLPPPVKWICGALLLIIILIFLANHVGAPLAIPGLK